MFDVFTVLAKSSLVNLVLSGILLLFWMRDRKNNWLLSGAGAFLAISLATGSHMLAAVVPDTVRLAAANTLLVLGFSLLWQSMRLFNGKRATVGIVALATLAWPALWLVPGFDEDRMIRMVLFSLPMAVALGLAAREACCGRAENLPSRHALTTLLTMQAILFGIRIPLGPFMPFPLGTLPPDGVVVAGFYGLIIILSIGQVVLMVSLLLERAEARQRDLAHTDALTGLLNRHGLEALCENSMLPQGAAVIAFDLDRFKQVNDTYGHAAGDALISSFAQICRDEIRTGDRAVRLGGEEFVVVLAETDGSAARSIAERIRTRCAQNILDIPGGTLSGTVSGGIYCAPGDRPVRLSAAIALADQSLYRAKSDGRNRICDADEQAVDPSDRDTPLIEPVLGIASA